VTVEEGAIGGFATQVMQFMAGEGLLDNGLKFRPLTLPDVFIDHDKPAVQVQQAGLDAPAILASVLGAFGIAEETLDTPARA
jgi:1-deoxy-D-xylulose-5-phosphate synthase